MMASFISKICLVFSFIVACGFASQIIPISKYKYEFKSWPELRGQPFDAVSVELLRNHPELTVATRSSTHGIMPSLKVGWVFLYVNNTGHVVNHPETVLATSERIELQFWPEALGLTAEDATQIILKDKPDAEVDVLTKGQDPVTDDKDYDRVRIFVNSKNIVVDIPRTG